MSSPENEKPDPTAPLPATDPTTPFAADAGHTDPIDPADPVDPIDPADPVHPPTPADPFAPDRPTPPGPPVPSAPPTPSAGLPDVDTVLGPDQPGGLGTGFSTAPEPASRFDLPRATTTWNEPADPRSDTLTEEPPAPPAPPAPPMTPERRPFRMRTMVLGLVLLVVAGAVLLAQLTTVSIDPGVVVLGLMVAAGLMLIAGAARS